MITILSPTLHKWEDSTYLTDDSLEEMGQGLCAYRIRRVQNCKDAPWQTCFAPNWHVFYRKAFVGFMSKIDSRWGGERMSVYKLLGPSRSEELVEWIRKDGRRIVDQAFDQLARKTLREFHNRSSSYVTI